MVAVLETLIRFCTACGAPTEQRQPPDDHRPRQVCTACGAIHYENPKLVVGAIPEWEDGRILLCRRAIEPRHGLWTLPAGFMENHESTAEAAARETLEEANARVQIGELYSFFSIAHMSHVHLLYRAKLLDLNFSPGIESLEVRLFNEREIPWDELAFRTIKLTLQRYFHERQTGNFSFITQDLPPPDGTV